MNTTHYPTPSTTCPTCGLPGRGGHACTGAELVPGDDERHTREMPASIERQISTCTRLPQWEPVDGNPYGRWTEPRPGPCANGPGCYGCREV